ncbi:hypothetical protein BKE38_27435 [Pseudoroseomonas deserti]|uniref:Uncharacterized protein n=1 Tax=Teichococcus deserti TaxID=1817963 RepID=A0A1V2GU95_9PROT|nr:hypothetical protein [Pseudoroseomonas deserti]ONG44715.1 hypothetical protein BKE38_27435 [Pseudoroseomonas deserti]
MPSLAGSANPEGLPQDTPLAGLTSFDLTTAEGMAMLRHFDARLRRLGDPGAQRAAVRRLRCRAPLSNRAAGLLVLPGGALALREGEAVLVCDPAGVQALAGAQLARLLALLAGAADLVSVVHGPAGLRRLAGLPPSGSLQAATLLPAGRLLAPLLPPAAGWNGPALLRWGRMGCQRGGGQDGVVAWPMRPAPARLALGASVAGEALLPAAAPVAPEIWDAPEGDDRYQLLSTGLFAHLDELLGNEVSDLLRFELVDHWTDGEDSLASELADGIGLLPACFATPHDRPVAMAALAGWPRAADLLRGAGEPLALLGIAARDWGPAWRPALRQSFLRQLRGLLPAGSPALLVPEDVRAAPQPVAQLAADRQLRAGGDDLSILLPLPPHPSGLLRLADRLAGGIGAPVLLGAPAWGLCHRFDPAGGGESGNAAWFGHAMPEPGLG